LKLVHCFSLACVAVALGLFAAGVSGAAVFMLGLSSVIELVGSAVTGKQTNDSGLDNSATLFSGRKPKAKK
jgi:hypothetical protein